MSEWNQLNHTFKLCFRMCGALVQADTYDHAIIICKKEEKYVLERFLSRCQFPDLELVI